MEQKDRAYYLRVSQIVMVFLIIILEFVQAVGFAKNYRDTPTHSTVIYYWMATVFSFLLLGHLLIRFQPRWKHGPHKDEVFLDGLLIGIWLSLIFQDILPVMKGNPMSCNATDTSALARCNLFITSFVFTLFLTITLPFSLQISLSRWRNKQISSSIPMGTVNQQQQTPPQRSPSYVMQEVVLKDGQPALVFHSNGDKRSSRRASLYNHQRTNSNGSSSPKDSEFTKNARNVENHVTGENGNVKNVVN
ncbi:14185_t:CDS:2 [Dentiscutata heterogama]|uniref:14185_t:CDS:1 n=1 Tax=Dentiscutata heterogama TaxID=1316150 RepID=A0ACA9MGW4_9GLOM|nr:14185_t:CDS:2 [Dentiscutata heterogama]